MKTATTNVANAAGTAVALAWGAVGVVLVRCPSQVLAITNKAIELATA